jgi:DNA-binding NtrC family response regulator
MWMACPRKSPSSFAISHPKSPSKRPPVLMDSSENPSQMSNATTFTAALELTNGNREEAATMLGIGERTLYRKIKEYESRR